MSGPIGTGPIGTEPKKKPGQVSQLYFTMTVRRTFSQTQQKSFFFRLTFMRSLQEQIDDVDEEIKVVAKELLNISDIDDKKYYREKEMKLREKKRLFLQLKHMSG